MSSKAITEKPDEKYDWQVQETAPSVMTADVPTVARVIGFVGLLLFVLGAVAIGFEMSGSKRYIGGGTGTVFALFGLCGLLYHVGRETDTQIRRVYGVLGGAGLVVAAIVSAAYPVEAGTGALFLPWGVLSGFLALLFLLPAIRGETEESWRKAGVRLVGLVALAAAGAGLVGGAISVKFLLPVGLLLAILGLGYVWAFAGFHGTDSDIGQRVGTAAGIAGFLAIVVAIGHSLLTRYGWFGVTKDPAYLPTAGSLLAGVGMTYLLWAFLTFSDRPIAVLTRRELAAFFYSPLIYFVVFCVAIIAFLGYALFVSRAVTMTMMRQPMVEPIIQQYVMSWLPIFFFIFMVPMLTMRLFSEERRSQTLEVLMTAPLGETPVVLSKFFAVLIIYLLCWLPYGLYLIALRAEGGPFDYRPLISFFIGLTCSGAGALAMGVCFSSLTRHQLAAFVVSVMGMIVLTMFHIVKEVIFRGVGKTADVLTYCSYIDVWSTSLQGHVSLADVMFHISAAVFWLFVTVKVLEARKWL